MSGTHTVISNKISMLFGSEISLKDFSFSQLIVAVKNFFDTEGVHGFVKALVILIESLLIKSGVDCPHCGKDKHHLHSKSDRKIKTSIGEVNLALTRLLYVGDGYKRGHFFRWSGPMGTTQYCVYFLNSFKILNFQRAASA